MEGGWKEDCWTHTNGRTGDTNRTILMERGEMNRF